MSKCEPPFVVSGPDKIHLNIVCDSKTESIGTDFWCELCAKSFSKASYLRKHEMFVHENVGAFKCEMCEKSFSRKDKYKGHVKVMHENYRPFKCQLCEKSFYRSSHLKQHVDSVHEKVKFQCTGCGLKPFKCEVCLKDFSRRHDLLRHVTAIHNDRITEKSQNDIKLALNVACAGIEPERD
ncbi:hypothetical protein ACTXT7_005565 [Hymenolepis weldensis]